MFDVNQFLYAMKSDGVRPNLFEVYIPQINDLSFRFKAKATAIPASTLGIAPVNYFGRQVKLAGNRVFDNWTISVLLDETDFANGGTRYGFEQWSNAINNHINNVRSPGYVPPLSYMADAYINQYSKSGTINATYKMVQCWPVDIGPINLDWAADNQIAEFNVTFALQWWESSFGSTT